MSIPNFIQAAQAHCQAGRLGEAESLCRQVLQQQPNDTDSLHLLGLIAHQSGRHVEAEALIRRAISFNATHPMYHNNLGLVLRAQERPAEAAAAFGEALSLYPEYTDAHYNLGLALQAIGHLDAAVTSYRRALLLRPDFAEAHNNAGSALLAGGQVAESIGHFQQASALRPDFYGARQNLAVAYHRLGLTYQGGGDTGQAMGAFRAALASQPEDAHLLGDLGHRLLALGDVAPAAAAFGMALDVADDENAQRGFAAAIRYVRFQQDDPAIAAKLARAISGAWARPAELARAAISLIKVHPSLADAIRACDAAWPERLSNLPLAEAAAHTLLHSLLMHTPVTDLPLERFLTCCRRQLLAMAEDQLTEGALLSFHAALARQCFNNEYVFSCGEGESGHSEELIRAGELRRVLEARLRDSASFPPQWLPAVASYFPLGELQGADYLAKGDLPLALRALVTQQVAEPAQQAALAGSLPQLSPIDDAVSRQVREQYEVNPYPRWVNASRPPQSTDIVSFIRGQLPRAPYRPPMDGGNDILVAGCGTGQHSIQTAQQFPDANVLAIDLSRASLAYALRKTHEAGIANLTYAQADIMALDLPGRAFDLIESVGVLHHLADPAAGWRRLLALLAPDGVMRIALYSEFGRQGVVAARRYIAEQGFPPTAAGIRMCREAMTAHGQIERFRHVVSFTDFFSASECRDLMFHVQEHRFTLPMLEKTLASLDLQFLGWVAPPQVLDAYAQQFPADTACTSLANWHLFETDYPETFASMYHFFVQPRATAAGRR